MADVNTVLIHLLMESSSSSDEDENVIEALKQRRKKPKVKNFIAEVVEKYNDDEFRRNVRISRRTCDELISLYEGSNFVNNDDSHGGKEKISAEKQIISFLWFAGNQAVIRNVAELFDISESTFHGIISKVIDFLVDLAPQIIKFPKTMDELQEAAEKFEQIYFSVMSIIFIHHFKEPQHQSVIEPEGINHVTNIFFVLLLGCSICGIAASFLLIIGLYRDKKILLIPWILTVSVFILIDLIYCTYIFIGGAEFNPLTAILFTIDFFLASLNVYALLCVISQYQEYKAGRGTAEDDQQNRIPSVHYSAPTTTTYLSTKRAVTYAEPRPTPTQSPTGAHTSLATEEPSPNPPRPSRKHVQFPDIGAAVQNGAAENSEPWTIEVKSPMFRGVDTTPLIESCVNPAEMHPTV